MEDINQPSCSYDVNTQSVDLLKSDLYLSEDDTDKSENNFESSEKDDTSVDKDYSPDSLNGISSDSESQSGVRQKIKERCTEKQLQNKMVERE